MDCWCMSTKISEILLSQAQIHRKINNQKGETHILLILLKYILYACTTICMPELYIYTLYALTDCIYFHIFPYKKKIFGHFRHIFYIKSQALYEISIDDLTYYLCAYCINI